MLVADICLMPPVKTKTFALGEMKPCVQHGREVALNFSETYSPREVELFC